MKVIIMRMIKSRHVSESEKGRNIPLSFGTASATIAIARLLPRLVKFTTSDRIEASFAFLGKIKTAQLQKASPRDG
ncbi:MAG: hypothetical protein WEB58_12110 [Planctomycetaceae bacterium]